ncbi:MAG: precorrin-6y C5,15-methyltransferase (decarboxylating) subunit CbiE [Micromonosporaceae bacterium]
MTGITVIGVDGGALPAAAARLLAEATLVAGGARHLAAVELPGGVPTVVMGDVAAAVRRIASHDGSVVVLASGDPGFFGVVGTLRRAGLDVTVIPGVSSVAAAFGRVGIGWDDALVVSAHGRELRPVVNVCRAYRKVAVLTAPDTGPAQLAAALEGLDRRLVVAERLGTPDERVVEVSPWDAVGRQWADPNVTLVLAPPTAPMSSGGGPVWIAGREPGPDGWALPEDGFAHRDSMITKYEVRALALARLAPKLGDLIWDVGAGSGSVAVECARFGAAVIAVERDADSCDRIAANAARYGVDLQIVSGAAPDALIDLPAPDAVYVGGGGPDVLAACLAVTLSRIVAAYAGLERGTAARQALRDAGYQVDGTLLHSSRLADLAGATRLAATNPVLLLWGVRP